MEKIDVVYTWVNDQQPGYRDILNKYAKVSFDLDPGRTRDFLELLRFSLRSLEKNFRELGNVFILTMRPQVPKWLDVNHPRIKIVHHDEIINPSHLPTFNSLAIVSHLHLIPGLSEKFLYVEDDFVFTKTGSIEDFLNQDGKYIYRLAQPWGSEWQYIPRPEIERPWNLALAESNRLLDQNFGYSRRRQIAHAPILFAKSDFAKALDMIPSAVAVTRSSKFRESGNVALEYFIPYLAYYQGKAVLIDIDQSVREAAYVPLENFWPATWIYLCRAVWHGAKWMNFNDNLGTSPSRVTELIVGNFLRRHFGSRSEFELDE